MDGRLVVTHSDTCIIGDAHMNACEDRHSFLRQWLAKFRGVSNIISNDISISLS